jgi:hypothetical protein
VNPLLSNKGKFNRIFADSANINSLDSELRMYKSRSKVNEGNTNARVNSCDMARGPQAMVLNSISEDE